jgi:hypothetical protein
MAKEPTNDIAAVDPIQIETVTADQLDTRWRWAWWGLTFLAFAFVAFWGIEATFRRRQRIVQDSPKFKQALKVVTPLVHAANPTPRAIKRYQNRMRYLSMRLRPPERELSLVDWMVRWLGKLLNREWIPEQWFKVPFQPEMDEPKLLFLGAIEVFAPLVLMEKSTKILEQLAQHLAKGLDWDESRNRKKIWDNVAKDFRNRFKIDWPTEKDLERYRTFVHLTQFQ